MTRLPLLATLALVAAVSAFAPSAAAYPPNVGVTVTGSWPDPPTVTAPPQCTVVEADAEGGAVVCAAYFCDYWDVGVAATIGGPLWPVDGARVEAQSGCPGPSLVCSVTVPVLRVLPRDTDACGRRTFVIADAPFVCEWHVEPPTRPSATLSYRVTCGAAAY